MSRLEWILTGLLAILVVLILALLLLFWSEQRQAENFNRQIATEVPDAPRGTAQRALEVVAPAARQWAGDAVLLHARGSWPPGTTFAPERGDWSFLYYSPRQQALALIVPAGDGANVISENPAEQRFEPAGLERWQVDSAAIVAQLMENGGREFVAQYGEVSLILALSALDQLVWTATLSATEANKLFRLRIDPATGQIIE